MWALDWLVCIWKVCSQESQLLSLGISQPWEEQSLQNQQNPRCKTVKSIRLTQNTICKRCDNWYKLTPQRIQSIILAYYINFPCTNTKTSLKDHFLGFLVAQWWRIRLPMPETRVQSLVQEDPTCRGATKPMHHSDGVLGSRVQPLQPLKPVGPELVLGSKRSHRNEEPSQCNQRAVPAQHNDRNVHAAAKNQQPNINKQTHFGGFLKRVMA